MTDRDWDETVWPVAEAYVDEFGVDEAIDRLEAKRRERELAGRANEAIAYLRREVAE